MIKSTDVDSLPNNPGCYLFVDENNRILYIGKAKNLKKRVSSYFQKKEHDAKTRLLVSLVRGIDYIVTESEAEALLLENNLIKLHYPKFNLDLKDSRRYAYLHFVEDEFPYLEVARKRGATGDYYGPFVSGASRKIIMDIITRTFRVLYKKPSPQLKKLMRPNAGEYAKRVAQAKKILRGKVNELITELESEMKFNSARDNFEYALTLRNQINALQTLKERQYVEFTKSIDANVINYQVVGGEVFLLVFNIRKGIVEDKQEFTFDYYEDFFEDFLLQFFDTTPIPDELIVPTEVSAALIEILSKKANKSVGFVVPKQGDKKELLDFVAKNITATFFSGNERVSELQNALGLEKAPRIIECFDVSHLAGTNTVAAMVTFVNGFPDKSNYRRFRINTNASSDDLVAMKEAIERRYSRVIKEKLRKPDLIVIDGGPTQLSTAKSVLDELKLRTPIISLAKQFEEIYSPTKSTPIILDKKNKGLQLLQVIRDEAHRFAINYQKLLRKKQLFD